MSIIEKHEAGCASAITDFCHANGVFRQYGIESVKSYEWPKKGPALDELVKQLGDNFHLNGDSNYEKNVALKLMISDEIQRHNVDLDSLAAWIITTWGGIPKLSKSTQQYIKNAISKDYPLTLTGVASYSKLFAMFYPEEFAIYDARVAVSLNIIQLLSTQQKAVFFPYLSGRNKITGYQSTNQGFSRMPEFSRKNIAKTSSKLWKNIPNDAVYSNYNRIINSVCTSNNWKLYDVEMLLFSKAEDLVRQLQTTSKYQQLDWSRVPT